MRRASSYLREGKNSGLVNGLAKDDAYFFFLPSFFFAWAFFFVLPAFFIEPPCRIGSELSTAAPVPQASSTSSATHLQLRSHYKNDGRSKSREEWHFGKIL